MGLIKNNLVPSRKIIWTLGGWKPFNCSPPVLFFCFFLSLLLSLATSIHWFAPFWCEETTAPIHNGSFILVLADQNLHMLQTPSHQRRNAWPTNCTPNNAHASIFLYFRYSTHKTHSRHFRTLRLAILLVTSCFFHLVLLWKEFNSHSFVVTFHFSCSPPVFYPAVDDCWIHVNIGCSACIYSISLVVSLNDEFRLAHLSFNFTTRFHSHVSGLAACLICG